MAHVSQEKKDTVAQLVKDLEEYPIIGAVNMANLPAPQLQNMRSQLRKTVVLTMTKRRLIKIALDKVKDKKPGIEKLADYLMGMPALLFTKDNPFTLNKQLQKNKSSAPAKAGQTAPNDIIVPAGPTPFAPGPVIGELSSVGIKNGVENGKVAIKEDSEVAKMGDTISAELAGLLTRLGIEPMEVGLDLTAAYEGGTIYTKDILNIDEQEYLDNLSQAATWAVNLSLEAGIPTKDTVGMMITKSHMDAMGLGREQKIMEPELMEEFVSEAERSALSVKSHVPDQPVAEEKPAEEPAKEEAAEAQEEKPAEESKEEKAEEKTQDQ